MSIIPDSMTVPLKGDFSLGVLRRGKKYIAEFVDWQRKEIITVEGSTAQISRARMLEVILRRYYSDRAPLPEYATIKSTNKK